MCSCCHAFNVTQLKYAAIVMHAHNTIWLKHAAVAMLAFPCSLIFDVAKFTVSHSLFL